LTSRYSGRNPRRFYDHLSWIVVRAPSLPIEAYLALTDRTSDGTTRWRMVPGTLLPEDPWIRLALVVGGGHLIEALRAGAEKDWAAAAKLLRYQIRMSTRPTPYGLFAGVGLGRFGAATDLALSGATAPRRARPDMEWLLSLAGELEARPEVLRQLEVMTHPAVFAAAGRIFLNDPTPLSGGASAAPVSVRQSDALDTALSLASTRVPFARLADQLGDLPGADPQKVDDLLTQLWRQGLLITDLRPGLTSASPAGALADRLLSLAEPPREAFRLKEALDAVARWERCKAAQAEKEWLQLDTIFKTIRPIAGTPLQVDLALSMAGVTLSRRVATEVARAADLLLRLTPLPHGAPHLAAYRAAFEARYGLDRDVPLLELLDPKFGLGPLGGYGLASSLDSRRIAIRNETLQTIAFDAIAERRVAVELDETTLNHLALWDAAHDALPLSLDLSVFVLAASASAIDAGDFRLVLGPNLGARQAGRYLGRFADLLGRPAETALTEIANTEAVLEPYATWAELVYLPRRLRSANVTIRPAVRDHEIAVGVCPGVAPDRIVPLSELVVGIRDGRFRLRWAARGTDVVVRAGHMLTNLHAPEVCRFLDEVAEDGIAQLAGFDWGPAANYPFLPRIECGPVILTPARWRITVRVRDTELQSTHAGFLDRLARFREHRMVPRYVYLTTGDNRLLLDLDAPDQAEELRAELTRMTDASAIVLNEALPGPEHAWLEGPDGHYLAEFVVPLALRPRMDKVRSRTESPTGDVKPAATHTSAFTRSRPPGSDWLFAKLYCPPQLEEDLLIGPLREFCDRASRGRITDGWFFVRYSDPDPHIRLRFRGNPDTLLTSLLPDFCSWGADLMAEGLCQRFVFDTYEREVERYGGPAGMAAAEAIFTADSPAVVDLLALLRRAPELDRLIVAVVSIDDLLSTLGLDESERLSRYRNRPIARRASGTDFRRHKARLRALLGTPGGPSILPRGAEITSILAARQRVLSFTASRLAELERRGELGKPRASILQSVVHMHCNRLAGSDRSIEERAVGLLARTRESLERSRLAVAAIA
jgi:thiopeptide-type bacteriocin biosynthesis protein